MRISGATRVSTALRIYSTKAQVNEYNYEHLVNNNKPAIQVTAVNRGKEADKTAADKAGVTFTVTASMKLFVSANRV